MARRNNKADVNLSSLPLAEQILARATVKGTTINTMSVRLVEAALGHRL